MKKLAIIIMVIALLTSLFAFNASAAEKVIYVKDGGEGDGSSPENAMGIGDSGEAWADAPLYQAWEELKETGGVIVICGPYTLKGTDAKRTVGAPDIIMDGWYRNPDVTITYTSVYGGVDYRATADAKLLFDDSNVSITFPTATVLKDINVVAGGCPADNNRDNYLCAAYQPLTLGQGTNFVANAAGELPVILGGHRNYSGIAAVDGDSNIVIDIGNANTVGAVYGNLGYANKNQYGGSNITVKSGKVNGIYGDNQNNHGYGMNGAINITIEGGIICGEVAATNGGIPVKAFEKDVTPVVNIKISGGDFSACTGVKATSQFFDDSVASNAAMQAPGAVTVDCSAASWTVYDQVFALAGANVTVTEPANPRPSEGGDSAPTGDVIAIVLATMAVSGLGIVVLKKKEF